MNTIDKIFKLIYGFLVVVMGLCFLFTLVIITPENQSFMTIIIVSGFGFVLSSVEFNHLLLIQKMEDLKNAN